MPEALERLISAAASLPEAQIGVLAEMAEALRRPISCAVRRREIVTEAFEADFSARLRLFHATHDAPLTKKTFEYFFCGASRAAGRQAHLTVNGVHPGEDVVVDGVGFSLKTEGRKKISRSQLHISKLMEARWIRRCAGGDDFAAHMSRIEDHLGHYTRILTLRSFTTRAAPQRRLDEDEEDDGGPAIVAVEYDLEEIPRSMLERVAALTPSDFTPRTPNGTTTAIVRDDRGWPLFTLRLDGSVEKVTISNLRVGACVHHAKWTVLLRR